MADDDAIEIDEFAIFQARSMGVETEYLEMAKAGRHHGRGHRNRRGEETSPGTSSGRRRGQRSSAGHQRSTRQTRSAGYEDTETPHESPNSQRQYDAVREGSCRGRPCAPDDENYSPDVVETDGHRENNDESQLALQRSHSYRSKRSGNKQTWAEEDLMKPDGENQPRDDADPLKCDLKRTLTMPAKRYQDRAADKPPAEGPGRDSVRFSNRTRDHAPLNEDNEDEEEERSRTVDFWPSPGFRGSPSRSDRSENGEEGAGNKGHVNRARAEGGRVWKGGVAWKDTATNGHNYSPSQDPGVVGKKSCLLQRSPQTPDYNRHRMSNESNARSATGDTGRTGVADRLAPGTHNDDDFGSRPDNGRGGESGIRDPATIGVRVATSRVERPPPGNEATVYKVLVLGSQGVGKSIVTQQLLAAGNGDDDEDESSADRIVSVQVDDDETLLEFIDSATCQANRMKQVADANLVVYSVTDRASFAFAQSCLQELRPAKRHNVVILVANKQDLVRNRVISEEDGKNLAAKRHCKFIEVSALLSLKMDDLLVGIARQIRLRKGRAGDASAATGAQGRADGNTGRTDAGLDSGFGCLQRAALHAIRKVFRRRPVESTSCDNLCTP